MAVSSESNFRNIENMVKKNKDLQSKLVDIYKKYHDIK